MSVVLAADTTTSINSVALCRDEVLLAETSVDCRRLHSERLLSTVDWVLQEAGVPFSEVDLLAISIGPGSFTGLRIGAATWQGLAVGRGLPLVGVPTLDAMTGSLAFDDALVCPMLDARMSEVFGALFRFQAGSRDKLCADRVGPVESFAAAGQEWQKKISAPLIFLGNGAYAYETRLRATLAEAHILPPWQGIPRASAVGQEGLRLAAGGAPLDPALAIPVYLRLSQPEEKRAKQSGHHRP